MSSSPMVVSVGAVCFGVVTGFITYRTLVRKDVAVITDISGVIAAVGGGAIAVWFDRAQGDSFGWYSMGLLGGMILYYVSFVALNGRKEAGRNLGGTASRDVGLLERGDGGNSTSQGAGDVGLPRRGQPE
jgi:hypothetical protein